MITKFILWVEKNGVTHYLNFGLMQLSTYYKFYTQVQSALYIMYKTLGVTVQHFLICRCVTVRVLCIVNAPS